MLHSVTFNWLTFRARIDIIDIQNELRNKIMKEVKLSSSQLWAQQAPSFNFELNEKQLLKKALSSGFVTKVGPDLYLVNNDY